MALQFNGNMSGSLEMTGPVILTPLDALPVGEAGMLAVSGSYGQYKLYFYTDMAWREVSFV